MQELDDLKETVASLQTQQKPYSSGIPVEENAQKGQSPSMITDTASEADAFLAEIPDAMLDHGYAKEVIPNLPDASEEISKPEFTIPTTSHHQEIGTTGKCEFNQSLSLPSIDF